MDNWQWWIEFEDEPARGFPYTVTINWTEQGLQVRDGEVNSSGYGKDLLLFVPLRRIRAVKRIALPKEAK